MNRKNLIRAGAVVAAVALIIIVAQILKKPVDTEEAELIRPVKTLRVADVPSQFRREFPGRIEASQQVDLSFLSPGDLVDFPGQEGQFMDEGELIAALDAQDAQSNLAAAQADLDLARAELDRNQTLFEEELISEAKFDVKRRSFNVALAAYDQANKAVRDRQILAPFNGLIAKRYVENLEKVQAGQPIVTFIDPQGLNIAIDLPESVVAQLPHFNAVGSARFEQKPGIEYPLTVKEFATVADPYTKTYTATFMMPRPDDIIVLPDMSVTVNLDVTRKNTVDDDDFVVPSTAIVYDVETDDSVIWIVDESTDPMTVTPRKVEAERAQGDEIVVNGGLQSGDLIVIAGGGYLNRGQQVQIFKP